MSEFVLLLFFTVGVQRETAAITNFASFDACEDAGRTFVRTAQPLPLEADFACYKQVPKDDR